jgi:hypothetical protein
MQAFDPVCCDAFRLLGSVDTGSSIVPDGLLVPLQIARLQTRLLQTHANTIEKPRLRTRRRRRSQPRALAAGPASWPRSSLSAGFAEDPLADRDDKARILGNRHELGRRQQPSIGMSPPDERFGVDHHASLQIDFGLIVQDYSCRSSVRRSPCSSDCRSTDRRFSSFCKN